MKRGKRNLIYIIILCILIIADQITKYIAKANLESGNIVLIDGVLEFMFLKNTGAAFSMLRNNVLFFIIVTFIVMAVIVIVWMKIPDDVKYRPLRIVIMFIASGAIGNLIDRIALGYVRDFIYFSLIDFPVFNVADIYVTCSAFCLIFLLLFKYKEKDFEFLSPKKGSGS